MACATAWPAGKDPVRFAEETRDATSVTFGNPDNDFLKRLSYRVQDDQKLRSCHRPGSCGSENETWTLEKQTDPVVEQEPRGADMSSSKRPVLEGRHLGDRRLLRGAGRGLVVGRLVPADSTLWTASGQTSPRW